ncbi:conserved hypothetical protein [Culex quinquefasciatus]|uniref:Uncharacterized protein n=1 Tax=Culex quinquefasciatus TaxID=7176 RepID=B0WFS1_CULQU|nr:conserved hypothetical protein [Culex quinquefasciatus]|eukprot:XP_001847555.1 conserved hypothetical protein [Culex quinquefasciatus]
MTTWKLLLVLGLTVGVTRCSILKRHDEKPVIVCSVNMYPVISDAILSQLAVCGHIIVSNEDFCKSPRQLKNFSDSKRVALIRSKAPQAKILREVEILFDERFVPDQVVRNVKASVAGGPFDGVELVFDSAHLDQPRQIKYAQFLKLLKRNLDDNVIISSSFVCRHYLPAFLLNAMSEVLDYVILVPSSQNASAEGNALAPRVYTDSVATCLLNTNFPRSKIILGLPTGGMLVDPTSDRESSSSLIPYGNVCELQEEQQRNCDEQHHQNCSLFEDGVKLIYDDPNSAGGRALQVVGCKLRGISIALSYDDPAGICVGSSFPLLAAIQNVFEHRASVSGIRGCPCGTEESGEVEHASDPPCLSNNQHQPDNDCCCNSENPCDGCKLLNRLQGAMKTSEHVASISKSVADKVLESLDRVVVLISYMLGQNSEMPEPVPQAAPSSLLDSVLSSAVAPVSSVTNQLTSSLNNLVSPSSFDASASSSGQLVPSSGLSGGGSGSLGPLSGAVSSSLGAFQVK